MKTLVKLANNKNLKLNIFLNKEENIDNLIDEFLNNIDLLNIIHIRTNNNGPVKYSIVKEHDTKTWLFITKNIFILHLPMSNYRHFYDLYKDSKKYKFLIYIRKNQGVIINPDSEIIVFCVSHLINDDNYSEFMEINKKWSKQSSYILSKRLGFFIPVNKPYCDLVNKDPSKLLGISILGNAEDINIELNSTINFLLYWINSDKNNIPYHNLILHR